MEPATTLELVMTLLPLLMAAESNFDPNAVNGEAVGILQITPIMVEDVNRIMGFTCFTTAQRQDQTLGVIMFLVYYEHYTDNYKIKRTMRELAAMWVAGPDGYKQLNDPQVIEHWNLILKAKERQKNN